MKLVHFYRKPVSVFVMVAFTILLCFWANQSPAAPAAEKSSTATLENNNGESTGFIEQEAPERAISKGKKFPWLIVAVVAVAGGAALYFLVLKKKDYTLTVTVGEGVTGTPVAGTSTNKKGTAVAYSYSLQSGYDNLTVTLDGTAVAASGTVTMNANHTLAASATKTFVLTVSQGRACERDAGRGTYTYASGASVPYNYAPASGYDNLEVKLDGAAGGRGRDDHHERQPYPGGESAGGQHRGQLHSGRGEDLSGQSGQRKSHPLHLLLPRCRDQGHNCARPLRLQGVHHDRQRQPRPDQNRQRRPGCRDL